MLATKVYLWSHAALVLAVAGVGLRRYLRRDALAMFGDDVLRILVAFMLLGGGAVLAVR
jgi:hypothetical protein